MKKLHNIMAAFMACLMLGSGFALTSCDDGDDVSTNQYVGGVKLNVFGPSPVARGGELRFLGSGMNQITSVTLPGSGEITDIKVISPTEIRIMVPQDAEPGYVVLHYANGDLKTKTLLTFTEPISLDEIAPMTVKPGDEISLKGDYLNLIHEVIFAKDVVVPEEEFTAHGRYEIKLVVPAEAQTGKLIISDAAEMPNYIYSDDELTVVLPTAEAPELKNAKPGDVVTVKGTDLKLVTRVVMPNGDDIDYTVNDEGTEITFVLPDNASEGAIVMIPASGVAVTVANIGVAVPDQIVADPATDVWAGDVIKLTGLNMELVTDIVFPNVADAVEPTSKSATELTVVIPEGAQSGKLLINAASGAVYEGVELSTLKPEAVSFNPSPAALAGNVTVKGRNLQNVAKITFAAVETLDVSNPSSSEFSVTVPATLQAGANAVVLTLTNGETVEVGSVELSAPECAYATELPAADVEIRAGETFVVGIANADKLTSVKVNGQPVQYILNGDRLIIQVPQAAGKKSSFTLVSSNGEISYDIAVIPATHVENVIWSGMWESGNWGGNQDLAWGGYDWSQVPAGAVMTLYMTPTVAEDGWWCVSLRHGDKWGDLPAPIPGQYDSPEDGVLAVTLTADVLADLVANNGLVITGASFVLNKITIEWEISLETTIWNAGWTCVGWAGNQDLAWGGYDWSSVTPGQTMRLYLTPTVAPGEWWCVALRHGDGWKPVPTLEEQYNTPESPLTITLTSTVIDDLVANGGLVISGDGFTLDKITIE